MNNFLSDPIWFPPINVVHHFKRLEREGKLVRGVAPYKKAHEAYAAAISLLGYMKGSQKEAWLQMVDDKEQSPDVRTGYYEKKAHDNDFSYQDIEVVSFEEHSTGSVLDFLLATKLSGKKAYDDKTTILCHVQKPTYLPPWRSITRSLKELQLKTKPNVIILGRIHPVQEKYVVARVYPEADFAIEFDLAEECKKGSRGTLALTRSAKGLLQFDRHPTEKHYPFEKLGIV